MCPVIINKKSILIKNAGIVSTALGNQGKRAWIKRKNRDQNKIQQALGFTRGNTDQICSITFATKMKTTGFDLQFHMNWNLIVQRKYWFGSVDIEKPLC